MTIPSNPETVPPGWYPTTPGSPQLRWWDGTQWTDNFHTLGVDSGVPLKASAGTSPYTVWIWIFAVLPLLQLAELPLIVGFYQQIFGGNLLDSQALLSAEYGAVPQYAAIDGISLLIYGVFVVLAALDYRALNARGVPRPFHWAWTFLSSLVYIIGRTVVVRRRTGVGLAPMWVNIVALVVVYIAEIAVLVPIMMNAFSSLE